MTASPLDAAATSDFYELVIERQRRAFTIMTSNREPAEWLTMMNDALLDQSAVNWLTSTLGLDLDVGTLVHAQHIEDRR